jgi:hypothetical protein
MRNRYEAIFSRLINVAKYIVLGIVGCTGLFLLFKWWEMPSGASISLQQVKDAMNFAIPVAIGMALGELSRQLFPKRPKPTE